MSTCRFEVNVPNPGPRSVIAELTLEKGSIEEFVAAGFGAKAETLEIRSAAITLDPCGEGGDERLDLELEPMQSVNVYVLVETAGGPGAAILHLVDRRAGHTGGVMLACVDGLDTDPPGQLISPEVPCPIELIASPYACLDEDPAQEDPAGVVIGQWATLVFPLGNKSSDTVEGSTAYIEHLGGADAEFEPGSWQMGAMAPGDIFLATWRVRADSPARPLRPCVVVGSDKTDPVRLTAELSLRGEVRSAD